jgi:hypothetical protein
MLAGAVSSNASGAFERRGSGGFERAAGGRDRRLSSTKLYDVEDLSGRGATPGGGGGGDRVFGSLGSPEPNLRVTGAAKTFSRGATTAAVAARGSRASAPGVSAAGDPVV